MLLGVDIGTTHIKACIYDREGNLLGGVHRPTPTRRLRDGGAEYDAYSIERAVFGVIEQVSGQVGPPQAIGIASIGESGFLIDSAGEPLVPAIAWFDGRTAPQAAYWQERMGPLDLFSRTELRSAPLYPACKLEWHKENSPEAWRQAAAWLGLAEYLVFRMTGERGTDPSLASRTMLFRVDCGQWDPELCDLAGVPPDLLPPVREAGTCSGGLLASVARRISAPQGIPVFVCGHDHVCGAFGAGATGPGEIVNSIGTAEACLLTLESPPLSKAVYELNLSVGRHVLPDRFYLTTTLPESGGAVDWMLQPLGGGEEDLSRWTDRAGDLAPGEGGAFLPLLHGEDRRMALFALSMECHPEHFLRALLEGLTLGLAISLKRASLAVGIELASLTLMGGGAKNLLWGQLKADASGLPVRTVSDPECAARGAAMLAGIGAGTFGDHASVPAPQHQQDIHRPSGERAVYERLYYEVHEPLRERLARPHSAWLEVRQTSPASDV
ncbi:MAG: FGGY family carbohydrate kinase [Actinomycetota bacterium]|nr:FGGY family carbohydrate kinase [Actinomycetota bacterium]